MDSENFSNAEAQGDSDREMNGHSTIGDDISPSTSIDGIKKPLPVGEINDRLKKKGKRFARQNSREGFINIPNGHASHQAGVGSLNFIAPHRRWKNSRRSRNGHGRGLPKKGGAGGKGVWGKIGSEIIEAYCEDQNDPNYDSEGNDKNVELREVIPEVTPEEFFKQAEPIILEYFEHGDTHEAAISLHEIVSDHLLPYVTSFAVEISMDHKNSQREMTSVLISDLYGRVLKGEHIVKGFEIILGNLPDLILDTPEAPLILGNFLARAVADDCIPPKFVTKPDDIETLNEHAIVAIKKADALLSIKTSWVHLDNVWGMGGPLRPVKFITRRMMLLLVEYLSSKDIQEAQRCLRALEVPHFHHELVYEAVVMTLENAKDNKSDEESMCEFLKSLDETCLVSRDMMEQGIQRVFDDMADINIDVPRAYTILERFIDRCDEAGFLSEKIMRNMPNRGRKRFVSEGDGGLVKPAIPLRD